MPSEQELAERVTQLEMLFTYLQQTVGDLNQVVIEQRKRLDQQTRTIQQLSQRFNPPADAADSPEDGYDPSTNR